MPGGLEDVTPHVQVTGTEESAAALRNLGDAGAAAFAQILEAASHGDLTGLVTQMFGHFAGEVAKAVEAAGEFVSSMAELSEGLENLGSALRMSAGEMAGLQEAFASVGIGVQGFERAMGHLGMFIGNTWAQVQQEARTASDAQTGAMLHMQQATLNVSKAYESLNEAFTHTSQTAAHDALAIESAAQSLAKAQNALADAAGQSNKNSLALESAELGLERAKLTLQKDQGFDTKEQEKALKLKQDQLAVREAEQRVADAAKVKAREGLEMEVLQHNVAKARQEVADAAQKKLEDEAKAGDKIKQAQLDLQKAKLAEREASEKMHEQDLKDIPKIANEIDNVSKGYKNWDQVANHAEISAQNVAKALLLAAKGGGDTPDSMEVFKKAAGLFKEMGDGADAAAKKMEIVQKLFGAGFRPGMASAAQMIAILEKGPEAVEKFIEEGKKLAEMKLGGLDLKESQENLKEFNAAAAELGAAFDQVKMRIAAALSPAFVAFFKTMKESLTENDGVLHQVADSIATMFKAISSGDYSSLKALGSILQSVWDIFKGVIQAAWELVKAIMGVDSAEAALNKVALVLDILNMGFIGLKASVGIAIMAVGVLVEGLKALVSLDFSNFNKKVQENPIFQTGKGIFDSATKQMDAAMKSAEEHAKKVAEDEKKSRESGGNAGLGFDKPGGPVGQMLGNAFDKLTGGATAASGAFEKTGAAGEKAAGGLDKAGASATNLAANIDAASAKVKSAGGGAQTTETSEGKASGGLIRGPGGPTSDAAGIFALSDGEYVVRSAAVSHYGTDLFNALNSLAVGGFAVGGLVSAAATPKISAVSTAPSSVLNLTIDGNHFDGLRAPDSVASRLKSYAVSRQASAAGNRPSWYK